MTGRLDLEMAVQAHQKMVLSPVVLAAIDFVGNIQATPALDFTGTTLSKGGVEEFDVNHHLVGEKPADDQTKRQV